MRYLLFLSLLLILSCTANKSNTETGSVKRAIKASQGTNSVEVDAAETGVDLTSYLRRVSGVSVRGSGAGATIRIRGDVNFNADSTPLFVLNGTVLGNNFANVYNAVDINEIARVRVLKNISDTNRYGMQGANGVIEIKLRN